MIRDDDLFVATGPSYGVNAKIRASKFERTLTMQSDYSGLEYDAFKAKARMSTNRLPET